MLASLDALILQWTSSTPRRPHKTPAHTVKDLFRPERQALSLRSNPATFRPGEPHILHPFSLPSTPQFVFLSPNQRTNPFSQKSFHPQLSFNTSPKGRESYIHFYNRQPPLTTPPPSRYPPPTPAGRAHLRRFFVQTSADALSIKQRSGARAQNPVCRAGAGALHPHGRGAGHLQRHHRRCARRVR